VNYGDVVITKPLTDNYLLLPSQGTYCVRINYQDNSTSTHFWHTSHAINVLCNYGASTRL